MTIKRSIYDFEDENVGANKSVFAVVGFVHEEDSISSLVGFKVDHWNKEEYKIIKVDFKETENIFYVKRLDSDLPILQKYLEPNAVWIPLFDLTNMLQNGFTYNDTFEKVNMQILKELETLNN